METLLPAVAIWGILMYLRFKTGAKVYNLLSIGVMLYLAIQYSTSIPMILTFVGMIMYGLWDTFFEGR